MRPCFMFGHGDRPESVFPNVPRQFAIIRANKYMIDTADTIICYVKHVGNSRNLLKNAQRRQKKEGTVIENVAENI